MHKWKTILFKTLFLFNIGKETKRGHKEGSSLDFQF